MQVWHVLYVRIFKSCHLSLSRSSHFFSKSMRSANCTVQFSCVSAVHKIEKAQSVYCILTESAKSQPSRFPGSKWYKLSMAAITFCYAVTLFLFSCHLLLIFPNPHEFQNKHIDFGLCTTLVLKRSIQAGLEAVNRSRRQLDCSAMLQSAPRITSLTTAVEWKY